MIQSDPTLAGQTATPTSGNMEAKKDEATKT
jgi:hypothetical protein